jgi:catechol 2,3-dioxygenase-like lactoylglutathione lyase family enzyme
VKIKSVSGVACFVKDLNKTAKFYEALGFEIRKRESNHMTAYSNWFWIDFVVIGKDERTKKDLDSSKKGAGVLMYLSVDNVDEFHSYLVSQKLKPSKPEDQPWGNREFTLRDPDGYNLVLFKRR